MNDDHDSVNDDHDVDVFDDQLDELPADDPFDDRLDHWPDGEPDDPWVPADDGPAHRVPGTGALVTDELTAHEQRSAELQDVHFGTSWTVPGRTESGNAVEWSTSYNGYYDQKTGGQVEPT